MRQILKEHRMNKGTENKNFFLQLTKIILLGSLVVACAKELPDNISEDIEQNVHPMSIFDSAVTLKSSQTSQVFAVNATPAVSRYYAVNQKGLRPVSMISGDKRLAPFFKDLKIETSSPNEEFKVSFKLTNGYVVAYIQEKDNQSDHYRSITTNKRIPIFQFPVSSFGVLEKDTNSLGEETRTVVYKSKDRTAATHVKINPMLENRVNAGLRETEYDTKQAIFRKKSIDENIITLGNLKTLFKNNTAISITPMLSDDKAPLKLKLVRKKIYIQKASNIKNISKLELAALRSSDKRINKCDKRMATLSTIKLADCVLTPVFSISTEHIKLKLQTDEGQSIATVDYDTDVHHSKAKFIKINLEKALEKDVIGQDINFTDKVLISKKDQIEMEGKYLYVPMTLGTPREVKIADPFFQGSEKVVKLQWAKDGLEVLELDKENRWNDNPLNTHPVLKIPGSHKDYTCTTDANGECTNGDQENNDITWSKRRFFMPDFAHLKVNEINSLNLFTLDSPCLIKGATEVVGYTMEKGVINIDLERTYTTANSFSQCLWEHYVQDTDGLTGFSNTSFKTRFSFSLVKLKDLETKGYKSVAYPIHDHDKFGFFKNKTMVLNLNNDSSRKVKKYLLNRWAPGTEAKPNVVKYFLSDSYFRPENKLILEATKKSEKVLNDALAQSKSGIRLEFDYQSRGKSSGDLRNNVLVLIDDPLANGLLGYAPTVTHPYTGEILQGHVNMYGGVLTSQTRWVWQSMVDLTNEKPDEKSNEVSFEKRNTGNSSTSSVLAKAQMTSDEMNDLISKFKVNMKKHNLLSEKTLEKLSRNQHKAISSIQKELRTSINPTHLSMKGLDDLEKGSLNKDKEIHRFSSNNAYSEEFMQIAGSVKVLLPGVEDEPGFFIAGTKVLKEFDDLSPELQKKARDIIVPYSYTSTLIHEFGHNLGLRHNFIGSFDKDNFYTKDELDALGARVGSKLHNEPTYSSVMDYAISTLNELTVFGKYDIAALRFAYAREIELKTKEDEEAKFVKVETTLQDLYPVLEAQGIEKKDFNFCTDGNAGLSTSCNRFDEGTSLVEIIEHRIARHHRLYKYRNFRDGRDNFSVYSLEGYLLARNREFNNIRDVFEDWERFATIFDDDLMVSGCSPEQTAQYPVCVMINDRRDAVKIAGQFFLDILKTPDHMCALSKIEKPTASDDEGLSDDIKAENDIVTEKKVELKPLAIIYEGLFSIKYVPTSCFDPAVKKAVLEDGFKVVGEAGKFINGFKDSHPDHIYSSDRYVLGVWADKLMAAKSLFQRETGRPISDEVKRSFMDHPEIAPKVLIMMSHLASGTPINNPVKFKRENGELYEQEYEIGLGYLIKNIPDSFAFRELLGLPEDGAEYLNKVILNMPIVFGQTEDVDYRDEGRAILNTLTVRKKDLDNSFESDYIITQMIDDVVYGATEDNIIAYTMIESIANAEFLNKLGKETVLKVIQWRMNPPVPADLAPAELAVWTLPIGLVNQIAGFPPNNPVFTEEFFVTQLGEEVGKKSYLTYLLGKEKIDAVLAIKEAAKDVAPAEATEDEKKLYDISINVLANFIGGELTIEQLESYQIFLDILPKNIQKAQN
jgi:hypothetical protein